MVQSLLHQNRTNKRLFALVHLIIIVITIHALVVVLTLAVKFILLFALYAMAFLLILHVTFVINIFVRNVLIVIQFVLAIMLL